MTREGHAVSQFAVSFYAPDSQQAGLLARAQEIENLEKQTRAQAIIARRGEEPRWFAPRPKAATPPSAWRRSRKESAAAQSAAHQQQVELLRLTQLAEQTSQRREQLSGERAALERAIGELDARRAAGESRFEALDAELGVAQERHAELDEAARAAERALAAAREERARPRAPGAGGAVRAALRWSPAAAELERSIETAAQQLEANRASDAALAADLERLTDAEAEGELQAALATKLERETALGERRSLYDDLTQRLRARRRGPARPRAGAAAAARQGRRAAARGAGGAARRRPVPRAARGGRRRSRGGRPQHRGGRRQARRGCRAGSTPSTARSSRSAPSTWRRSRSSARRASARASSTRRTPTCPRR